MNIQLKKYKIYFKTSYNYKFRDSEKKQWKTALNEYNFYNTTLTSRKLIIKNFLISSKLIKYFFLKFYYETKYKLKKNIYLFFMKNLEKFK